MSVPIEGAGILVSWCGGDIMSGMVLGAEVGGNVHRLIARRSGEWSLRLERLHCSLHLGLWRSRLGMRCICCGSGLPSLR